MSFLIIAGGVFMGVFSQQPQEEVKLFNHTLRGERIPAEQVVCRSRWGTPMLPEGKGGYSLIAPINEEWIARSLIQPPRNPMVPFRPAGEVTP